MMDIPYKIVSHPNRKEIDERLLNGDTISSVVKYLEDIGEPISRNTLGKYKKNCLDVNAKAIEVYTESQAFTDAVNEQVSAIELRNKFIKAGTKVNTNMIDDAKMADLALRAAREQEVYFAAHGDKEAELQTQLMKEMLEELRAQGMDNILRDLSDRRTSKRIEGGHTTKGISD